MTKRTHQTQTSAQTGDESLFSTIISLAHETIIVIDQDQNIILFNRGAERIFGYSASEVVGQPLEILLPPALSEVHRVYVNKFSSAPESARNMNGQHEISGRRKNGDIFPAEASIVKVDGEGKKFFAVILQDVTERKKSEMRLNEPQRIAGMGSWELDLLTNHLFWSNEIFRIFEIDKNRFSASYEVFLDLVHPDDRDAVNQAYTNSVKTREPYEIVHRLLMSDGRIKYLQERCENFYATDGTPLRSVGMVQDITELKQMKDETVKLQNAVEQSADIIFITDHDGNIEYVNPAFKTITGYSRDESIGKTPRIISSGLMEKEHYQKMWSTILSGDVFRGEVIDKKKNGEIFYYDQTITPIKDAVGNITHFVSTGKDVTERKRAEETLMIKENAIASSISAIAFSDLEGRLNYVNEAFLIMWGYNHQTEVLGKPAISFWASEEQASRVMEALQSKGNWVGEMSGKKNDGMRFDALISANLVKDRDGKPICMMASFLDITERKQAEARIETHLQRLAALHTIDMAITSNLDLRLTLEVVLEQAATLLGVDAASVLLFNPKMQTLEYAAGRGFRSSAIKTANVRIDEGFAGSAVLEQRIVHVLDPALVQDYPEFASLWADEEFAAYYVAPLIVKGQVKGVLEVFQRAPLSLEGNGNEWLNFLETLARQAAISVDNAQLFDGLQRANTELIHAYDETIVGWSQAMDLRDKETEGHTLRVTEMTVQLAQKLGFNESEIIHIRRGALLHDIGKMGVPDDILRKSDQLTEEEWVFMRQHPQFAYDMLSHIDYLKPALDIPYCHHEKWDGTGYPRGLKGEQIPLAARIFALADVWDALRSDRPYRKKWSKKKTIEYIRASTGTYFDPVIVKIFLDFINSP